jgi:hypothetical protein
MRGKIIKPASKEIDHLAGLSEEEFVGLEDKIMERALALWRGKGRYHQNAWSAWLQAEREILSQLERSQSRHI